MLQQSDNTTTGPITSQCPMKKIDSVSDNILAYIRKKLIKKYGDKKPPRAFHAKCIGLVRATIKTKSNLSAELKVGLFKDEEKEYKAWIRFSNGSSDFYSPDAGRSVRGMAIKVRDVTSNKFIDPDPEGNTQDIILFTNSIHMPDTVSKQELIPKLVLGNKLVQFAAAVGAALPFKIGAAIKFLKQRIETPNILEEMYFSATPYKFGDKAIKWHARPLKTITSTMPSNPGNNFLRKRLIDDLSEDSKQEVSFGLYVQFQNDEKTQPIEDPSIEWKTPFHQVAIINIQKQKGIDTHERAEQDLNMSFSPGHAMQEHAPLGGVNMIRRKVYGELGKERREHT